jgi:very-short-patch-repair endonuclease
MNDVEHTRRSIARIIIKRCYAASSTFTGGQHATDTRDAVRDQWLAKHRYRVLRFWNNDVLGNTEGVLEMIAAALPTESPPPDR